jgi:predicted GNAT superfamily acetyltransferase
MSGQFRIGNLRDEPARDCLLDLNNRNAGATSLLTPERFALLIDLAGVALCVPPAAGLLLAFEDTDDYDGGHFLWFRSQFDRFLYIDRIVIAENCRRHGLARMLYDEVFERARRLGHSRIVCEVNLEPPNPISDHFHAALGFQEVGRATINDGAKTVRYLAAHL